MHPAIQAHPRQTQDLDDPTGSLALQNQQQRSDLHADPGARNFLGQGHQPRPGGLGVLQL
jgi:hypothetical protein